MYDLTIVKYIKNIKVEKPLMTFLTDMILSRKLI